MSAIPTMSETTMMRGQVEAGDPDGVDLPTGELVREAISQAKALTKLEIALARDEMLREIAGLKSAVIFLVIAVSLASVGSTLVIVTLALLAGAYVALVAGLALLVVAAIVGFVGWGKLPKKPMGLTAERLHADVRDLKERMV